MLNRKSLARTSSQPGKTRQINFYNIDSKFYFVDLPGFGYSKMSHAQQEQVGKFIEEYLFYLKYYEKDGVAHTNDEKGIKRKLASLRTFYNFYFRKEFIDTNPASKVRLPRIHEKNIIRLDVDEVARLLDEVESGENL